MNVYVFQHDVTHINILSPNGGNFNPYKAMPDYNFLFSSAHCMNEDHEAIKFDANITIKYIFQANA